MLLSAMKFKFQNKNCKKCSYNLKKYTNKYMSVNKFMTKIESITLIVLIVNRLF